MTKETNNPPRADQVLIRRSEMADAQVCEEILRSLPDWFGIEQAIVQYRRDIEAMETHLAVRQGQMCGFLTLKLHNQYTAEIQVMGVRRELHGQGIGRALVAHAEQHLRSRKVEYLEVKTLGPSRPDDNYDRTRGFYLAMGFRPIEENNLWN